MLEFGSNLGMPHTKPIDESLFEMRVKGKEGIARVFYCTMENELSYCMRLLKNTETPKERVKAGNSENERSVK